MPLDSKDETIDTDLHVKLGKAVREVLVDGRREKTSKTKVSQTQLARQLGVRDAYLSEITRNLRPARISTWQKLADELGMEWKVQLVKKKGRTSGTQH